jgi:serine/threonine protein kinase
MPKVVQKAGKIYGQGAMGQVTDVGEIVNIQFYNQRIEKMRFNQTPDMCNMIFKKSIKGNLLEHNSVELTLDILRDAVVNIDKDIPADHLREIANNALVCGFRQNMNVPMQQFYKRKNVRDCIVFAIVDGKNIYPVYDKYSGDLTKFAKNEGRPLNTSEIYDLTTVLLYSAHTLHSNKIYHNDIKPANILYKKKPDGTYEFALGDFGLLGSVRNSQFAGTPRYQSPLISFGMNPCFDETPECSDSFADLQDIFIHFISSISIAAEQCREDSDEVADVVEKCIQYQSDLSNKLTSPAVEASRGWEFLKLVEESLKNLCSGKMPKNASQQRCDDITLISNELMGLIFQKNELYAIGVTLNDVLAKKWGVFDDAINNTNTNNNNNSNNSKIKSPSRILMKQFIKKLSYGDVRKHLFFADNSLEDFENYKIKNVAS